VELTRMPTRTALMHAALQIDGATLMLCDDFPSIAARLEVAERHGPVTLCT